MRRNVAIAVGLALTLAGCGGTTAPTSSGTSSSPTAARTTSAAPGSSSAAASTATTPTTPTTPGTTASGTGSPATSGSGTPAPSSFTHVPLWPFASVADAQKWQQESGPGGHQAWHLDAGQVALAFTRQYLGFTEIDRVVGRRVTGTDAHVSVGFATEGGHTGTAAVVHLVPIGSGPHQPWEVVGTDDTSFSLTHPAYGSSVSSGTVRVGGHISGVDESIRVTARQLSGVVGSFCCLPAGGGATGQDWTVKLQLTHPKPGALTIVASTGGHLLGVERFTVTGVRAGG